MNVSINRDIPNENHASLMEKINKFLKEQIEFIIGSTQNNLLQTLKAGVHSAKHIVKLQIKGPAYLYDKFSKEYEEMKPLAEELSKELSNLDGERKHDSEFVDQFTTMSEIEKNEYKKEIKKGYDMLEWEIIPIETRLQQLKDTIKHIKELAFGDRDPNSVIFEFIIDFSLMRDEEEEILSDRFREKRMDILRAIKTYATVKGIIKDNKETIEKKYGNQ